MLPATSEASDLWAGRSSTLGTEHVGAMELSRTAVLGQEPACLAWARPGGRGGGAPAASLFEAWRGGRRWLVRRGAGSGGERGARRGDVSRAAAWVGRAAGGSGRDQDGWRRRAGVEM